MRIQKQKNLHNPEAGIFGDCYRTALAVLLDMDADPIEERLLDKLAWGDPQSLWRWAQASTVLVECGLDRPTKIDSATAGSLIRARNGNQTRRSNGQKLLLCPTVRWA